MNLRYYLKKIIYNRILFFLPILILLSNCGRKNNNFLSFPEKKAEPKVNILTLPLVKNITIKQQDTKTINIEWQPIDTTSTKYILVGYNVYRFFRSAFIPKKPLNKKIITTNSYIDTITETKKQQLCYVVRGVFKHNNNHVEGPTSAIICKVFL